MLNTNLSNIIIKRLLNHKLIDFRCKEDIKEKLINSLFIHEDFISTLEEKSLFQEIDPFLKNLIYENDHWDDTALRLSHINEDAIIDVLIPPKSLYIIKDFARYNFNHEILATGNLFKGSTINKERRISIICRNKI
ncbi:unnamed protein product [Gordionus sp. m RMFG-2023]